MPIVSNAFQPAPWANGISPFINSAELSAMSNAIKASQGVGSCDTAAATAAKTLAIANFTLLVGATVSAQFSLGNTAAAATLNVNGTGAFGIRCRGAEVAARDLPPGYVGKFQYDGSYWQLLNPAVQYLSGTATLVAANWTGTAAPFVYSLPIAGITGLDILELFPALSHSDTAGDTLITAEWSKGAKFGAESFDGRVEIYGEGKPSVNIPIIWKVVR